MDGLSDEERALAWGATWNPNFIGVAIIDPDMKYRSVNEQWRQYFGVTPAEFVGKNVIDMTPPHLQRKEQENAQLLRERKNNSYILPKHCDFSDGRKVDFVQLMVGVYHQTTGELLFFVSRIMRENSKNLTLSAPSPKQTSFISQIIEKRWHIVTALIGALALLISETIKALRQ